MIKDLQEACGLPVSFDTESSELILGDGLNDPSYCVRNLHDLKAVWANPIEEDDQVIYRYTSALHLKEDAEVWKKANMAYGIVIFVPGTFSGEYVKSSGQFHPPVQPSNMGTPEIYTVLSGVGSSREAESFGRRVRSPRRQVASPRDRSGWKALPAPRRTHSRPSSG